MGTCKKKPQRDRRPGRAQVRSPCRVLFCRHTGSAPSPPRCPCLLDEWSPRDCRLLTERRPRIGNRFGNRRGYRQRNSPNSGSRHVSRRRRSSGAPADSSRPPYPALSNPAGQAVSTGHEQSNLGQRDGRCECSARAWLRKARATGTGANFGAAYAEPTPFPGGIRLSAGSSTGPRSRCWRAQRPAPVPIPPPTASGTTVARSHLCWRGAKCDAHLGDSDRRR